MACPKGVAATALQVILDIMLYIAATFGCMASFVVIPPAKQGFFCDDTSIKKSKLKESVPFTILLSLGLGVPIIAVILLEFFSKVLHARRKSGRVGQYLKSVGKLIGMFLYGLTITMVITECLKLSVGRLRPYFIETCRPNISLANCAGVYMENVTCAADINPIELNNIRKSFPSGHASLSMYAATFFIVYVESRFFFTFSLLLKSALQVGYLLFALYTSASRVSDNRHHLSDVIVGAVLGILCAVWTVFFLAKHLRVENTTSREVGGDLATALYKEPMPCHHQPDHNTQEHQMHTTEIIN